MLVPFTLSDFLGFANFYKRFIKISSKIAMPLILILKTLTSLSISNKKSMKILANSDIIMLKTKIVYLCLKQIFIKVLIFSYLNSKHYI